MRTVTMSVNASKFTGRMFTKGVGMLLRYMNDNKRAKQAKRQAKEQQDVIPHGKQTVKQLVGQNQGVTSIEIHDKSIREFEKIANKYGVDFAITKVKGQQKFMVFFKARDTDVLTAAFTEFSNKQLNRQKRPSLRKLLHFVRTHLASRAQNRTQNQNRGQVR